MFRKSVVLIAAASMAASPCAAASLEAPLDPGARRSGATAAVYFKVPLSGTRSHKARGGLRLAMTHDYRHAGAQTARVVEADAIDLRLIGKSKPTLYVAGQAVTGDEAKRNNLGPVTGVVTLAILAAALVGGYFILRELNDSDDGPQPN